MDALLRVNNLQKNLPVYSGGILRKKVTNYARAVDGVTFTIGRGEVLPATFPKH
ncbi:MAG: hypothetical protein K8L91_25875 [Anaerolineae bacterium]|nr:hypothetical protein [Anaerolineae bacterium]